jgi:hypothetical protein
MLVKIHAPHPHLFLDYSSNYSTPKTGPFAFELCDEIHVDTVGLRLGHRCVAAVLSGATEIKILASIQRRHELSASRG